MSRYVIRFGNMRQLGVMSARGSDYRRGQTVVIRSPRGTELGQVLCEATDDALSALDRPANGNILREEADEDTAEMARLNGRKEALLEVCWRLIRESGLPMKLVDIEQLLGGERMIVYYVSEDRVDFRELVKAMTSELQTRIELHQIGARDEARLLADYGDCGKPVCCNTHLSSMPPVSMRMAKLQKATLDPNKISGRCGRLKCCLRYEFDTYEELQRELPRVGADVVTREGRARVIGQEILAQQLLVETEDHRRILIAASEVLSVLRKGEPLPAAIRDDEEEPGEREVDREDPRGNRSGEKSGRNPGRRPGEGRPDREGRDGPRQNKPERDKPAQNKPGRDKPGQNNSGRDKPERRTGPERSSGKSSPGNEPSDRGQLPPDRQHPPATDGDTEPQQGL